MNQHLAEQLKIIPLGGLNEIGKNMTVYEYGGEIIVVDCGMAFPGDDMYGIDCVIPDVSYLVKHKNRIRGMFITHGHEDHIGARALHPQKGEYSHLLHAPDRGAHPLKAAKSTAFSNRRRSSRWRAA